MQASPLCHLSSRSCCLHGSIAKPWPCDCRELKYHTVGPAYHPLYSIHRSSSGWIFDTLDHILNPLCSLQQRQPGIVFERPETHPNQIITKLHRQLTVTQCMAKQKEDNLNETISSLHAELVVQNTKSSTFFVDLIRLAFIFISWSQENCWRTPHRTCRFSTECRKDALCAPKKTWMWNTICRQPCHWCCKVPPRHHMVCEWCQIWCNPCELAPWWVPSSLIRKQCSFVTFKVYKQMHYCIGKTRWWCVREQ